MADNFYPMGPGILLAGDPSSSSLMKQIQELEDFNLNVGTRMAFATTALTAGAPVSEGIYALPPNPAADIRLNDIGLDNLSVLFPLLGGAKTVTGTAPNEKVAMGFGGTTKKISPVTWCFVPIWEASLGVAAPHAIWFPRGFIQGLSNILFNRMQEGSSNNPVSLQLRAARGKTDAKATTPNAIPENYQYGWIGDPAALGLTYQLPTLVTT